VSPTLHVNPNINPCIFLGGGYKFTVLQLLPLAKWDFIQISITHDNISSQDGDKRKVGFRPTDETHPSIMTTTFLHHFFIRGVIQKSTIVT
jgi:hypothetical protein